MATVPISSAIPRFLLPRGSYLLRPRPRLLLQPNPIRHASARAPPGRPEPPKPKAEPLLAQPDKYRPPSHGRAVPRSITEQRTYGPGLTAEEKEAQKKKWYPNMMPPEGTFMHWFLHNKQIHFFITMGILIALSFNMWVTRLYHTSHYKDLLPERRDWFYSPIETLFRFWEIQRMETAYTTQEAHDKRMAEIADVEKRRQYREALKIAAEERGEQWVEDPRYYIGEDGKRRRRVKKWFGIWE